VDKRLEDPGLSLDMAKENIPCLCQELNSAQSDKGTKQERGKNGNYMKEL
jgi:hypothetical protein